VIRTHAVVGIVAGSSGTGQWLGALDDLSTRASGPSAPPSAGATATEAGTGDRAEPATAQDEPVSAPNDPAVAPTGRSGEASGGDGSKVIPRSDARSRPYELYTLPPAAGQLDDVTAERSAEGEPVGGFPLNVIDFAPDLTVTTSAVSPEGKRVQVSLVAPTPQSPGVTGAWALPADGGGAPKVLIAKAWSPALVRS
jgi:hypothetical protein